MLGDYITLLYIGLISTVIGVSGIIVNIIFIPVFGFIGHVKLGDKEFKAKAPKATNENYKFNIFVSIGFLIFGLAMLGLDSWNSRTHVADANELAVWQAEWNISIKKDSSNLFVAASFKIEIEDDKPKLMAEIKGDTWKLSGLIIHDKQSNVLRGRIKTKEKEQGKYFFEFCYLSSGKEFLGKVYDRNRDNSVEIWYGVKK